MESKSNEHANLLLETNMETAAAFSRGLEGGLLFHFDASF